MWGLVLISSRPVLLLGTGLCSLAFCFKGFVGSRFKRSFKAVVGRLTSQVSKRMWSPLTTPAGQISLIRSSGPNPDCLSREKTLDMAIGNIAHDIRTPLTIASGYTQQIIKGGTQEEESW